NTLILDSIDSARQQSDQHTIECYLPEAPINLFVDQNKMTQVIVNLISNAIKYSPSSSKIEVRAEQLADDIKITVKDQGIGIATEDLDKIFTQFYRTADVSSKTEGL